LAVEDMVVLADMVVADLDHRLVVVDTAVTDHMVVVAVNHPVVVEVADRLVAVEGADPPVVVEVVDPPVVVEAEVVVHYHPEPVTDRN